MVTQEGVGENKGLQFFAIGVFALIGFLQK